MTYQGENATIVASSVLGLMVLFVFGGFLAFHTARRDVYPIEQDHYGVLVRQPGLVSKVFSLGKAETTTRVLPPGDHVAPEKSNKEVVYQISSQPKLDFRVRVVDGTLQRVADKIKGSDVPEDSWRAKLAGMVAVKPLLVSGSLTFEVNEASVARIIDPEGSVDEFNEVILDQISASVAHNFDSNTDSAAMQQALEEDLSVSLAEDYGVSGVSVRLDQVELLEGEEAELRDLNASTMLAASKVATKSKVFWTMFWKTLPFAIGAVILTIGVMIVCPDLAHLIAAFASWG